MFLALIVVSLFGCKSSGTTSNTPVSSYANINSTPNIATSSVENSASGAATAFYKAGNKGDYTNAKNYLSVYVKAYYESNALGLNFENAMDNVTKDGKITKIEVTGGEEYSQANQASVFLKLYYSDGSQKTDFLSLEKVDGRWKILISSLLAASGFGK